MLSLNTLRNKFGIVLMVFIAVALLSFILGEFKGCSQNEEPVVGKAGTGEEAKEVAYNEFGAAYNEALALEELSKQMKYNNSSVDQAQIIAAAWEILADKHVVIPALEELGIIVTKAERDALWNNEIPSAFLQKIFSVPVSQYETAYDAEIVQAYLDAVRNGGQDQSVFNVVDEQLKINRAKAKFINLVCNGLYANSLMLQKNVIAANNTYKGKYVVCDYSSIQDSEVEVSQNEIEDYYSAHSAHYKYDEPYRNLTYVHFAITPSAEDKAALKAEFDAAATEFESVKNFEESSLSNVLVEENFREVYGDELKAVSAGKMYKTQRGNNWYASRVVESRIAPKTLDLQHILLAADNELVDDIYAEAKVKGADFDALVEKYSEENQDGNKSLDVPYSYLATPFADALANAKKGDVVKIENNGMVLITKVLGAGEKSRHYRLATLNYNLEASNETYNNIKKAAEEFAQNANGSVENFEKINALGLKRSTIIKESQRNIQGLSNSLEVLRWAYEANVGEISSLFDLNENGWVVAMVTSGDIACKSLEEATPEIKRELVNRKKAALLKAKMQGATLPEIAANAGAKVESFVGVKTTSEINDDARVAVALESVTAETIGKVLPLIEGVDGVYAVVVEKVEEAAPAEMLTLEAEQLKARATELNDVYNNEIWYEGKSSVKVLPNGAIQFLGGKPEYREQLDKAVKNGLKVVDNTLQYF